MDLVMQELEAEGGLRSVALLREVCKAWRAAFSAYPGRVTSKSSDLKRLLRIAPSMVSLELPSFARSHTDMQPISSNIHLTSLLLPGPPATQGSPSERIGEAETGEKSHLDLSLLPPCLRTLAVDTVYVLPSSFAHINSPGLEALEFCRSQNSEEEVMALLQCLPQLKVINCCNMAMLCSSFALHPSIIVQ